MLSMMRCSTCGGQFAVSPEHAGMLLRCPHCQASNQVPGIGRPGNSGHGPAGFGGQNPYSAPQAAIGAVLPAGVAPHRGAIILLLGILSCAFAVIGGVVCALPLPIAIPLGIVPIVMARRDMKLMAGGAMDKNGHGATMAGFITGIIGTVISSAIIILFCVVYALALGFALPGGEVDGRETSKSGPLNEQPSQ